MKEFKDTTYCGLRVCYNESANRAVEVLKGHTYSEKEYLEKYLELTAFFVDEYMKFREKWDKENKDENAKQCPDCQSELKLIPAGISKKSGKPYEEFYSCIGCKHTEPGEKEMERIKKGEAEDSLMADTIQRNK